MRLVQAFQFTDEHGEVKQNSEDLEQSIHQTISNDKNEANEENNKSQVQESQLPNNLDSGNFCEKSPRQKVKEIQNLIQIKMS